MTILAAVEALGPGALSESALRRHVDPIFSRTLSRPGIYLANHSLGRPLDRTAADVASGLGLWFTDLGDAWGPWLEKQQEFRAGVAMLAGVSRADCVIPKNSAGQGLRAVLGLSDRKLNVVTTRGEFDSIDVVLRHYAGRGRIALRFVEADDRGWFRTEDLMKVLEAGPVDLLVISQVMFMTGQNLVDMPAIVEKAHSCGARVLLDVYHAFGVVPLDFTELGIDYAIGGSYKYLRGGPGACWLYVSPEIADSGVVPLDTGWFAKENPFRYERPDPPRFAKGGDAFLESTPPVLSAYQASAGLEFTKAIGVQRLREYGFAQGKLLVEAFRAVGVEAEGARDDMGAFVTVRHPKAMELATRLESAGVVSDARAHFWRFTPDLLTHAEEISIAAQKVAETIAKTH